MSTGGFPSAPTLRQVASLAGVSPMTVSRTLSGGKHVRADLQERVVEAASELGYRRNESARSMRPGHRSNLIGVAIANLGNPYYGHFALGVERAAALHGRRILLGNTDEDPHREAQLVSDFRGRRVEGLIVVPVGGSTEHLRHALAARIPVVLASRAVEGIETDTVLLDDVAGAQQGTRRVLKEGHRQIAFLGHGETNFTARRRYDGFVRALACYGLEPHPRLVRHLRHDHNPAAARTAMTELASLPVPPTAVFATNNRTTIGVLRAITAHRAEQPDRPTPTIVSFDDVELAPLLDVPLVVISHNPEELGMRAAGLLLDRVDNLAGDAAPRLIELPVTIKEW